MAETALTRSTPATLAEPRWKVASSLETTTVGEVILLDSEGRVATPRQARWVAARSWLWTSGLTGAVGVVTASLVGSPVVGAAAAIGFFGSVLWQSRHMSALRRAIALVAAGEREAARAAFEALEQKRVPAGHHTVIDTMMGGILWKLGDLDGALARYQRSIDAYELSRHYQVNAMYWVCAFDRVQLLAASGKVAEAQKLRGRLSGAPGGEYFALQRILTDLMIAFHDDSTALLPEDPGDLYEWAKLGLSTSRFGTLLVLLSWAFERCGDEDMAKHLLCEAPERLKGDFLEERIPRAAEWMNDRAREWNIALDGDDDDDL
ncbi:MAG TPA: hypothetical protein VFG83_00130 [Kofleriaceae bacterium]|nr:hypothetical protein [Kofleriaceae bacterium]